MYQVTEIKNKKVWNTFLNKNTHDFFPFFQSWNWGEVQKRLGFPVYRVGLYKDKKLCGVVQIVEVHAKRGTYLHLRHGPVLTHFTKQDFSSLLSYVKNLAREKGCSFIRISPLREKVEKKLNFLTTMGFRDAPVHNMDSEICWALDIAQSEETLLSQMRKSHRYLIKKSLKEPIEIIKVQSLSREMLTFLDMYTALASKKGFVAHKGLAEELEILGKDNEAVLLLAEYNGAIIGGALVDFAGQMAIYHHGASDDAYRNLSVSYLLQWEAIREAKKRGKKLYNFWGIASTESKKHPWYGLTLFKMGFGGYKKEFMHAKDLPLSPWYWKNYMIEMFFKLRKGY